MNTTKHLQHESGLLGNNQLQRTCSRGTWVIITFFPIVSSCSEHSFGGAVYDVALQSDRSTCIWSLLICFDKGLANKINSYFGGLSFWGISQ